MKTPEQLQKNREEWEALGLNPRPHTVDQVRKSLMSFKKAGLVDMLMVAESKESDYRDELVELRRATERANTGGGW